MLTLTLALFALLILIFGFLAWNTERAKNDKEWPRLTDDQRQDLVNALDSFAPSPELKLYHAPLTDCGCFAADLSDVIKRAASGPLMLLPATSKSLSIPSGIQIKAPEHDNRGRKLQAALQRILNIKASLATNLDNQLWISIGARPPK